MRLDEFYDDIDEASLADIKKAARNAAIGATMGAAGLAGYHGLTKAPEPQQPAAITQPSSIATDVEPNRFKPVPAQQQKKDDVGSKEYGSTSQHADREMQSKLLQYARKQGIQGVELAALLAQSAHETLGFRRMVETGNREYFAKYDNKTVLGNVRPGDGYRFRGRTFLHITGRENYEKIGKAIGVDLVKHPELLEKSEIGLKASIWYWNNRVKPYVKDFSDVIAVTQRVQGSAEGIGDRSRNFEDYRRKLKV